MAARRTARSAFGASRPVPATPPGRALADGGLPRINRLVDLYNAVGAAHLAPVGGEDTDRTHGGMRLVRVTGEEKSETAAGGEAVVEHPETGEVVRLDDVG